MAVSGLLDRFFRQPGQGSALSILGASMMAAGARTTDPGASTRHLAEGVKGYMQARRQAVQDEWRTRVGEAALAETKSRTEARLLKKEQDEGLRSLLLGTPGEIPPPGPPMVDLKPRTPGSIEQAPPWAQQGIRAIAEGDPEAASTALLAAMKPAAVPPGYERTPGGLTATTGGPADPAVIKTQALAKGVNGKSTTKRAWDNQAKKLVFVTENMIAANGRYTPAPKGMKLVSDGKGGFTFRTGDMLGEGAEGLGTAAKTVIEKTILAGKARIQRLENVRGMFKAKYQTLGTRFKTLALSWKSKAGFELEEKDAKLLTDFSIYKQAAMKDVNLTIKEITGAQMGVEEVPRLMAGMPNVGQGLFDGDDPLSFKAKLDSTLKIAEKVNARYIYYLKNGITDKEEMAKRSPMLGMKIAINPGTGKRKILIEDQWVDLESGPTS